MAIARRARVAAARRIEADTRLLELVPAEPLGFTGGQYIIVDSGLVLDSGKAVKRAYSLLTDDGEQGRLELAVKRIPGGPCSGFVHRLEVGAEVSFSGPWGKLYPAERATGRALVLATDTGVTAALGLLRSARFEPLLRSATFVWLRAEPGDFLPDAFVRERIPAACRTVEIGPVPPIGHPERIPHARRLLADLLARAPLAHGFLAGDGAVNYALLDDLVAAGVPATRDSVESFFNMPRKASAASAA